MSGNEVERNAETIRRLYDELFSQWKLAVIDQVFSPDYIGHELPPGVPPGPEGVRQFYAGIRAALPDVRLTVEDLVAADDRVVVRWRANASHGGTFQGIPATGARVVFEGIAIYRLSNGLVVERWVQADLLGLVEQLRAAAASTDG